MGSDGNFYGTTFTSGASNRGTIFKITSMGKLTTLYSFTSNNGLEPYAPRSKVLMAISTARHRWGAPSVTASFTNSHFPASSPRFTRSTALKATIPRPH